MKLYCGECFEEMGNCAWWCDQAANLIDLEPPRPEDADNDPDQMLNDGEAET